jgi:hypothetical protein
MVRAGGAVQSPVPPRLGAPRGPALPRGRLVSGGRIWSLAVAAGYRRERLVELGQAARAHRSHHHSSPVRGGGPGYSTGRLLPRIVCPQVSVGGLVVASAIQTSWLAKGASVAVMIA